VRSRPFMTTLVAAALTVSMTSAGAPAARERPAAGKRPRIGLALSGGGARGAAHIGVLKVLEELRVPVDLIAGTSMGAIVGGLYAAGMAPQDIEEVLETVDWVDAFSDRIPREDRSFRRKRDDDLYLVRNRPGLRGLELKFPRGVLEGQKIELLLKRLTLPVVDVRDFDDLPIPYRAIAADIVDDGKVVLGEGDLALAIRASMSIPVVFAPREIGGRLLVDGGITANLPIETVREMGADVIIAVDISTPLLEREEIESVISISDQLLTILTRRGTEEQIATLDGDDLLIEPDLGDITTMSFDRAADAVPTGLEAAREAAGRLRELSVTEAEYGSYREGLERPAPDLVIDGIRVINDSRLSEEVITSRIDIEAGEPLDVERLEKDLEEIYGLELFESVYYDIEFEPGGTVLVVTVRENSWGPNYVQTGLAVFEDFEGPNFNLAGAYTRTAVNGLGAEWRTGGQIGREPGVFSEFYQPLEPDLDWFAQVKVFLGEYAENIFDGDGKNLAQLGVTRSGAVLSAGRELGTWGELRAGLLRESGRITVQIGDPSIPEVDYENAEFFARFYIDELDNLRFPRSGWMMRLSGSSASKDLGADEEYEQGTAEGALALTSGRYTLALGGEFSTTRDSDAPFQRLFRLGGFTRISGLEYDELAGQHAALVDAGIYGRIGGLALLTVYGGLSLEYGNVYGRREEITLDSGILGGSVFIGVDTLIGPLYVAYGIAEGGRDNVYVVLGQSFRRTARSFWSP